MCDVTLLAMLAGVGRKGLLRSPLGFSPAGGLIQHVDVGRFYQRKKIINLTFPMPALCQSN